MKKNLFYYILIASIIIADQVTKTIVAKTINLYSSVTVIPGLINLNHIHNRGAILGLFSKNGSSAVYILLTIASLLALSFVVYYFLKTPFSERIMKISLSLILAGALGNQIDRIFKGYVIDFIDVYVKRWHWPIFNIADFSISTGAILLLFVLLIRRPKHVSDPD